jgi:hypothetical protein
MATIVATVPLILDRVHEINKAIDTTLPLRSARYFPASIDMSKLPLITAFPADADFEDKSHDLKDSANRYFLQVYVGYFSMGVPSESALRNAERIIDPIKLAYYQRPRLELVVPPRGAPQGALAGVTGSRLRGHGGVVPDDPTQTAALAIIRFTLLIDTLERF